MPLNHDTTGPSGDNAVVEIHLPRWGQVTTCFWDTAGQTQFDKITGNLITRTDAILLMYSIDNPDSLAQIEDFWVPMLEKYCKKLKHLKIYLIANKIDLRNEVYSSATSVQLITTETGLLLAEKHGWLFGECSARENLNIYDALVNTVNAWVEAREARKNSLD